MRTPSGPSKVEQPDTGGKFLKLIYRLCCRLRVSSSMLSLFSCREYNKGGYLSHEEI
jgi:hypothetical protein